MHFFRIPVVLIILTIAFPGLAHGKQGFGSDLITMKNGDIHNGTVAREMFTLATPHGNVSIPYGMMEVLTIGSVDEPDRLTTRQGDTFSGRILDKEVKVLRVLDTMLPLYTGEIADITFSQRQLRTRELTAPDAVELQNGDRFLATILVDDVLLKGDASVHLIKRADLKLIDIANLIEGEEPRVQATLNDGHILQGSMPAKGFSFRATNRYGQMLKIPLANITTLAFSIKSQAGIADFNPRRQQVPKSVFRDRMVDGTAGPELIALSGGEYLRGDTRGDGDNDEKPPIPVKPGPFAIGAFEVTFEEYDRFCDATGHPRANDEGWGRGRRPVINVSWQDAKAFTNWLSGKTRQVYRLPSDAEWEYAARAGTHSRFWWGDEPGVARANCEGCGSLWDGEKTARVGKFTANPFGLHDTAGNVFEWVADCYHDNFTNAPIDGSALDKPDCGKRVIRGGAWSFPPKEIRSSNRWRDFPSRRSDDTGFRVVRELRQPGR